MLATLTARPPTPWQWIALALVGSAWAVTFALQLSGGAEALHHHELLEGGVPLSVAIVVFLVAWQVMVAAMMLPSSLRALRAAVPGTVASWRGQGVVVGAFLAAYAAVWSAFGLAAFFGDVVLHHIVDVTPWLEARPWVIQAGVLAISGAYQFTPMKRWSLSACRHPMGPAREHGLGASVRFGVSHAVECLVGSWALMLLMFAIGVAHVPWMVALTATMAWETLAPNGQRTAPILGFALLGLTVVAVLAGGAIGFAAE